MSDDDQSENDSVRSIPTISNYNDRTTSGPFDEHLDSLIDTCRRAKKGKGGIRNAKQAIQDYFHVTKEQVNKQIADDIKDFIRNEIKVHIEQILKTNIQPLEDSLTTKISDMLQNKLPQASSDKSYADILKRTKEQPTLVLSSKNPELTLQKMERTLNRKLDTRDLNIKTNRTRTGKLIIKAADDASMKKLQERLQEVSELITSEVPKTKYQDLLIFNAPEINRITASEEELNDYMNNILKPSIQKIIRTNIEDITLKRSFATKDKNNSNLIIQIEEKYAIELLRYRRITLGFNSCLVNKFIKIKRCSKCQSYEHQKHECPNRPYCGLCAEKHLTSECKVQYSDKDKVRCINCKIAHKHDENEGRSSAKYNHPALWGGCPQYKKLLQKKIKQLNRPKRI